MTLIEKNLLLIQKWDFNESLIIIDAQNHSSIRFGTALN